VLGGNPSRRGVIRKIAIKPNIYNKIYNDNNGHPISDEALKSKLIRDYEFNAGKVDKFIETYRQTIKFSGIEKKTSEVISGEQQQTETEVSSTMKMPNENLRNVDSTQTGNFESRQSIPKGMKSYRIPLPSGEDAIFTLESLPITLEDVDLLNSWLHLMKKSLTRGSEESPSESPPEQ